MEKESASTVSSTTPHGTQLPYTMKPVLSLTHFLPRQMSPVTSIESSCRNFNLTTQAAVHAHRHIVDLEKRRET